MSADNPPIKKLCFVLRGERFAALLCMASLRFRKLGRSLGHGALRSNAETRSMIKGRGGDYVDELAH